MATNAHGLAGQRPRIGLDLHVADGIFQGSRTHCLELFSRVVALTTECDFFVLVADPQTLLSFSSSFALPHVTIVVMPKRPAPFRLLWQLPQFARKYGISLLHVQYVAPPFLFCNTAVTIHDILFESHQEYFEKSFIFRSRLLVPYSAKRSSIVFTVSEYSRHAISETYSIPAQKIHTIPNGVDTERFFPGDIGGDAIAELGLPRGGYYLSVGRLEPRKNHATLLRAWAQIQAPRPPLVLVGQRHFQYSEVLDLIHTLHLEEDITVLEQVSDASLPAIYRNAKGFIYCSWAEGFGMPVLEAMASGIPVISSASTALSEVCADAALLVNPRDSQEIASTVLSLEVDLDLREKLIMRGLNRVRDFTWEHSAQVVRKAYLDMAD